MARKRLVVGNWKMYIEHSEEARSLALGLRKKVRSISGVEVWVAPPLPFIAGVAEVTESSPMRVGAQKVAPYEDPQHTGAVSAKMLKSAGALFVLVGHSEQRQAGETEEEVRGGLERAFEAGLVPILCIGEPARETDGEHVAVIERQLASALQGFDATLFKKLIIAYEPVWAIGKQAEHAIGPAELQEMVIFIRKVLADIAGRPRALKVPVLYGGSVEPDNASALVREGGVNGLLVGHASAALETFLPIIQACA